MRTAASKFPNSKDAKQRKRAAVREIRKVRFCCCPRTPLTFPVAAVGAGVQSSPGKELTDTSAPPQPNQQHSQRGARLNLTVFWNQESERAVFCDGAAPHFDGLADAGAAAASDGSGSDSDCMGIS
jgi:hypothetical protein